MAGRIAVVDFGNRFVRWEERQTIHERQLVHRSVHVLVFDGASRLLVQRRHRDKQTYPRFWDVSCAGHVEESDYLAGPDEQLDAVYAQVAARELREELGISPALEPLGLFGPEPGVHYEWLQLFRATDNGPYTLQADEVEEHRCLARTELPAWLEGSEAITHSLRWLLRWLSEGEGRWPASPMESANGSRT